MRVKKKSKRNRENIGSKNQLKDADEAGRQKVEAEVDVLIPKIVTSGTREVIMIDIYLEKILRDPDETETEKQLGVGAQAMHITASVAREGSAPRSVLIGTDLQIRI